MRGGAGLTEDYAAYRARMVEKAIEYEDYVFDLLRQNGLTATRYVSKKWQWKVGECSAGIEVKFDDRLEETGNIYIEIAEKAYPEEARHYCPSGIYRNDNSWLYIIGNYEEVYVFAKNTLQLLHSTHRYKDVETPTSRAFLLNREQSQLYAARVFLWSVSHKKMMPIPPIQTTQSNERKAR